MPELRPGAADSLDRDEGPFGMIDFNPSEVARYFQVRLPELQLQGGEGRIPCPIHKGKNKNFAVNALRDPHRHGSSIPGRVSGCRPLELRTRWQ